jgi:hypothetical protein
LQRKDWDVHRYEQISTKEWQSSYHMDPDQFDKLHNILCGDLEINEQQSMRSTGGNDPIRTEVMLGSTLRFINGGRPSDIAPLYGISLGSANRVIMNTL